MKLLLDEMYPRLIAAELRRRGHDATSAHDTPGGGATDDAVFNYARSEGRAIVTENIRDFRPLAQTVHTAGETHSGLILTTAKRWPRHEPGALITALDELVKANPDEIDNEEHWLEPGPQTLEPPKQDSAEPRTPQSSGRSPAAASNARNASSSICSAWALE